jgi:hypothetical protein
VGETEPRPYQVMPDLGEEEYDRLKEGIAENGIDYPITRRDPTPSTNGSAR